jgi:hypothetical protein
MYLVGWFAVAFILASAAMYVGRQWRIGHNAEEPSLLATTLAAALLLHAARAAGDDTRSPTVREKPPAAQNYPAAAILGALLVFSLLLLWVAAASDRAGLWDWMLWVRSPFLGARFQYFLWGAALGIFTQLFRNQIAGISTQAFAATIGNKETTAWALQGTLAILIIAAAVFAIKPDLLTYLRSLEYGGFKATFADHSTTVRIANLNYKELLWGFTLDQYSDFKDYIGPESDRTIFGNRLFNNNLSQEKRDVTDGLFTHYAQPIINSLICLERNHPTRAAARDPNLIKYGARWVEFLTLRRLDPPELPVESVKSFLVDINNFAHETTVYVHSIVADCEEAAAVSNDDISKDATKIADNYNKALQKLDEETKRNPAVRTLAIIDPYLVGAAGDLIVVLNGQKEKAEFLTRMLDGFTRSGEMMSPGIVNIFYQVADAQLKSFESWPAETILTNLNFAIKGVDLLIAKTSEVVVEKDKPAKDQDPSFSLYPDPAKFFAAMNRNLMILLAEKLALFNQRALAGEALSQVSREDWLRTYSRMIANSTARADAPIVAMDNLPVASVNEQSKKRWPYMKIEPEYQVDIDLATAVSSLLLEEPGKTSALSCNTALYYLNQANKNADRFIEKKGQEAEDEAKKQPRTEGNVIRSQVMASRNKLTDLQLKRILASISNWAGNSCDWKREAG